jgi:hypothetical protein
MPTQPSVSPVYLENQVLAHADAVVRFYTFSAEIDRGPAPMYIIMIYRDKNHVLLKQVELA